MQVTNKQLEEFNKNKVDNFINLSVIFLQSNFKKWCDGKTDDECRQFIVATIAFGNNFSIKKGDNLQKLMHYQIEFQFDIPVHEKLEKYLTDPELNENARVEKFYLVLLSGRYKLTEIQLPEENKK